jgi:hypothetical protein
MKDEKPKTFKFKAVDGSEFQIGDAGRHLELTPEKVEESIREQARLAESSPHIQLDVHLAQVAQARRVAVDWLEGLKAVELELHQQHTKEERKELRRMFDHYAKLLAEALATMGEFEQALTVLPKSETALKKEYKALHQAVWRDDDARCGAKCERAIEANPNLVTTERIHRSVWSKKHGRIMSVLVCSNCGAMNARPLDGQTLRRHQARLQADEIVRGKSPEDAVAALKSVGLTAQRVLQT